MRRGAMIRAALSLAAGCALGAAGPFVDCVEVRTRAPHNPLVKVWCRAPKGYDPAGRKVHRVLVIFGGRNCDGRPEVSGKLGWTEWADINGLFLVSPTLKDDNYWDPKEWSGRALLEALSALGAKFRIARTGLLYYGYSAGSQASNLFPEWRPDLCRAYVSHACGCFHLPSSRMRSVAGLVTYGDADTARYVISRAFVAGCGKLGVTVVWKSFPNHPHDVPPGSVRLVKEFLLHHHWSHLEDLGEETVPADTPAFVGDDADGVYYAAGSAEAGDIPEDDRVSLASETIAAAWGRPGRRSVPDGRESRLVTNRVDGVEVVVFVPARVRADSRVLLLFGGRGWTGARSIAELTGLPRVGGQARLVRRFAVVPGRRLLGAGKRVRRSRQKGCPVGPPEMRSAGPACLRVRVFGRRPADRASSGARSVALRRLGRVWLRRLS